MQHILYTQLLCKQKDQKVQCVCVCLYIISDAAEQRYMGVQRPWINSWASRRAWRCVRREK